MGSRVCLALLFVLVAPLARASSTYWTTSALLRHFFRDSERVRAVEILGSELSSETGTNASKPSYVVYVAQTGERVDGYAIVDDEKGQHMPITFGFLLDVAGRVKDVQIMSYREPYGDEIRDWRFLGQLVGKGTHSTLKPGVDVDGVTGATISVRATTVAARRALVLCDIARRRLMASD